MAVRITRKDKSAGELRQEAARCRDGKAARRMLAIWFWMGLTARRRQKTAAWIGRRCGIGPTVTMRRACRACSTVARRIHPVC